jgi:hypothetical protein
MGKDVYISVTSGAQVRIIYIIYINFLVAYWNIDIRKGRKYTYPLNKLGSENMQLHGSRCKCLMPEVQNGSISLVRITAIG